MCVKKLQLPGPPAYPAHVAANRTRCSRPKLINMLAKSTSLWSEDVASADDSGPCRLPPCCCCCCRHGHW